MMDAKFIGSMTEGIFTGPIVKGKPNKIILFNLGKLNTKFIFKMKQ